jgi:phospholipase/lecithinase/hemolysin
MLKSCRMLEDWLKKGMVTAFGLCIVMAATSAPADAAPSASIYAFGDSLTDTGNVSLTSGGILPLSPPYAPGRFSNGPIWIDRVAAAYGTEARPSQSGGNNYAFGGATTGGIEPPGVTFQTLDFLSRMGRGGADPNALYIVYGGDNDVRNELLTTLPAETLAAAASANIRQAITNLALAGAEYIMVPNLPDLAVTPESIAFGPAVMQRATDLSAAINTAVTSVLADLEAAFPIDLITLDVRSLINAIVANPAQHGLTNVTSPCFSGAIDRPGTICANPDEYLFWDSVHPTTATHLILGDYALAALAEWDPASGDPTRVAEPATLMMFAGGLLGLGLIRRRKA